MATSSTFHEWFPLGLIKMLKADHLSSATRLDYVLHGKGCIFYQTMNSCTQEAWGGSLPFLYLLVLNLISWIVYHLPISIHINRSVLQRIWLANYHLHFSSRVSLAIKRKAHSHIYYSFLNRPIETNNYLFFHLMKDHNRI